MDNKTKCCGTCHYHTPADVDEWCCDNNESENYGCETPYEYSCGDYEERE